MDERIVDLLQEAEQLKKELDSLRPLDKEREAIVLQKIRLDWNFHSNHLEGNSLTFGETKALILFGITAQGKPLKDHFEITGHDEAIKWVEDIVNKKEPLTENFIRQLHTLLLKEPHEVDAITTDGQPTKKTIKVGEYKSTPNHVKTKTGEIFRFATPEETPAKMNDLMVWLREKERETNPILLAADFHYKFIRIHPFDDGNGRVARILMNFILMQNGYPPVIIKTQEKAEYIAALEQADAGIFEPFIEFIITNEARSLALMLKGARGESIEDPDDLDKELALLEQRLKGKSKINEDTSFKEKTKYIIINNLIPLYKEILIEFKTFGKFYNLFNLSYTAGNTFTSKYEVGNYNYGRVDGDSAFCLFNFGFSFSSGLNVDNIDFSIEEYDRFFHPHELGAIELEYELVDFKLAGINGQNYIGKGVFFLLEESNYTVTFNESKLVKPYQESLSEIEIKKIVNTLKKEVKNYLDTLA